MKQFTLLICLVLTISFNTNAQKFKPSFSVRFDTTQGNALLWQCSRDIPEGINNFWILSNKDVHAIESNFEALNSITATGCCQRGRKVDSLNKFGFQYLGVVIRQQKFVYINAFPTQVLKDFKEQNYDFAKSPISVCDGGANFWGVLFDPETKQFSSLSFNGE